MSHKSLHTIGYILAYVVLWLLLAGGRYWLGATGLTPVWHAASGLHLALALLVPIGAAGAAIALATVAEFALLAPELPIWGLGLLGGAYGVLYTGGARLMQRYFFPPLASLHTARTFLIGGLTFPVLLAVFSVSILAALDLSPFSWTHWYSLTTQWALADAAGILTVAPLGALLGWSVHPSYEKRGIDWIEWIPSSTTDRVAYALEWGLVPLALYVAFFLPSLYIPQYYICFVPVLWVALRHGLPATAAVVFATALGLALMRPLSAYPESIVELQLFLIVLAAAGLLVGMLISERNRAQSVLAQAGKRLRGYLPSNEVPPAPQTRRPSASSAHVLEQSTKLLATTADQIASLNNELQASQERLRNTLAASNRMMSILSHDLKNPLVGIRGLAEVLSERENRPEREARMLRLIQQSSQQALDMVENLLMWSRLDTNKMTVEPSQSSLHTLVEECFTLLGGAAQHKNIELQNDVPPSLEAYVDPRMITIALRNFVSNAIKFTGNGGQASVAAEPLNEEWVLVGVADSGIGLSEDAQKQLFSRSSRLRSVPGTEGELGTGLGLHLCEEMIQQHHGVVWVESIQNKGSTFYFTIPRHSEVGDSPMPETIAESMPHVLSALSE